MNKSPGLASARRWPALLMLILMLVQHSVFAADYSNYISEAYLRTQFAFEAGDMLKYAQCNKKNYPTCTYIWGAASKKDASRVKMGLTPEGNKLQIVYARAKSVKDFQRVMASYSDAEIIEGLGSQAVWSERRKQLSLITSDNLIVHININEKGGGASRETAVSIANSVVEQL